MKTPVLPLAVASLTTVFVLACAQPVVVPSPVGPSLATQIGVATCHSQDGLPDKICTPGTISPDVTKEELCAPGYTTRSVRPAVSYTDALKRTQLAMYDYADKNPADYEEDHLIPLELGGNPTDPHNLWPQPRYGAHPAAEKDRVENLMKQRVCNGSVSLSDAQRAIATNWEGIQ